MFVLQFFCKARPDASILTNSLAGLYALYLQWITLSSSPDASCNKHYGDSGFAVLQIVLGMFITMFALFMMSSTHPTGDDPKDAQVKDGQAVTNNVNATADDGTGDGTGQLVDTDQEGNIVKREQLIKNHQKEKNEDGTEKPSSD